MKVTNEKLDRDGKRRVTVVLDSGEQLLAIRKGSHYKLAQPVDDIVGSHIIIEAQEVTWCSASQEWV